MNDGLWPISSKVTELLNNRSQVVKPTFVLRRDRWNIADLWPLAIANSTLLAMTELILSTNKKTIQSQCFPEL